MGHSDFGVSAVVTVTFSVERPRESMKDQIR